MNKFLTGKNLSEADDEGATRSTWPRAGWRTRGHAGRGFSVEYAEALAAVRRVRDAEEKETASLVWRTPWTLSTNITVGNSCRTTTLYTIIKCRWSYCRRGLRRVSTDHKKAIGLDCRASIGPRNGAPSLGYFRHGTELDGNITAETVPAIGKKSWQNVCLTRARGRRCEPGRGGGENRSLGSRERRSRRTRLPRACVGLRNDGRASVVVGLVCTCVVLIAGRTRGGFHNQLAE